jgi:hypothetical protein
MYNLLCEVLSMCYEISNKSEADVFFEYSPHIDGYMVYCFREGWQPNVPFEWIEQQASVTPLNLLRTIEKLVALADELGVK